MGLVLSNNVASLNAQNNLNKTNTALSKSLERLSTGLKVNRGADGPAALVISEQQRGQIAGLRTAIANTNKAVTMVQTAEGALNEINRLLTKVRSLALDSANTGINDANALAANQAEITNSLNTITSIANNTKFGTKNLLNGQAGVTGTVTSVNNAALGQISVDTGIASGNYTVRVTTQGTGGTSVGGTGAGSLTAAGYLTLSGGGLSGPLVVNLGIGDTATSSATKIQAALDTANSIGGGSGKFAVSEAAGVITVRSNILGSGAITVAASPGGGAGDVAAVTGFAVGAGTTGAVGVGLAVTVNGSAATVTAGANGLNNQVLFNGSTGLGFTVGVANGVTVASGAGSDTIVNVNDQSLTFQTGANAGETIKLSIDKLSADRLGVGVLGVTASDLSRIDVTTGNGTGAQDAIKVVDAAINQVSVLRGKLGAFQANSLESNANNLGATLENTVAAESIIRDTDFASEIAEFTKLQTQVQAGSTVLGNANQLTSLVASLLRG